MLEKTITIGDKQVKFRSSATIPRLYRAKFKRDIFKDLSRLESSYRGNSDDGSSFEIEDLEIFENVAYIMAYHADHSIPATQIMVRSISTWLRIITKRLSVIRTSMQQMRWLISELLKKV